MKRQPILLLHINRWLTYVVMVIGLTWACEGRLQAQGSTIPRSSQIQSTDTLAAELPEGVKYRYPLFNGLSVSVNIFEPVMELFVNEYASYEAMVTCDFHHRFLPQLVAGIGHCDETSDDLVRYHVKPTPYFKLGMAYNFKYNDVRPNDFYTAFVRYGFSSSKADIENLTYTDGYWDEFGPANIMGEKYTCHWIEIGASIKVQVASHLSMGWDLYFKPLLYDGDSRYGDPHFVPGYGKNTSNLGFAFHVFYDIF